MNLFSADFGAFVFGREILKKYPKTCLHVGVRLDQEPENCIKEQGLWHRSH